MYTDPVRQVKETIDAIEIPLSDGRIGYAMVFSSVLDLSEIDELTGLYTREAFFRYAQRLIDTSPDAEFDMFIVDIEAFRNVNRKYGEKVGDRVLQALADFIKTNTPDGICARLNSDLFVGIRPRQTGYGIEGTLRLTQEFIENAPVPGLVLKNGISPADVPIEITESAAVGGAEIKPIADAFTEAGFSLHIDDFGSGRSSLNDLNLLSIDVVKLDRSLISCIGDTRGELLLAHTITLGKALGLPLIAEGVEYEQQLNFLKENGCDYIQGYYYSRPLPESEFEKKVSETR